MTKRSTYKYIYRSGADNGTSKARAVYEEIRKITGEHAATVKSGRYENGKFLTDLTKVKKRCKEYFDTQYTEDYALNDDILNDTLQSMDTDIMESEVRTAIERLKQRKVLCVDNICSRRNSSSDKESGLKVMHNLCQLIIRKHEEIPSKWRRSANVPLHTKKDELDCSNY